MTSIKNLNTKITLLERKVKYGDNGGINVNGGLLEVDTANNKVKTASTRVSFGQNAGSSNQGTFSIAIGQNAGESNQATMSIAIGSNAGQSGQQYQAIAIGRAAGACNQGQRTVAIGCNAANFGQGLSGIAIGFQAAQTSQAEGGIALGRQSGAANQGSSSIAIGQFSGATSQGTNAVAIGTFAGQITQGNNAIAIGNLAGQTAQVANSIILNASGSVLNADTIASLYVRPLDISTGTANSLLYDPGTGRVSYNSAKTFVIDHPIHQDKYLVHSCLEGPEAGVYYRGQEEIQNNESVDISLPEYTKIFTDFSIHVTPIGKDNKNVYSVSEVQDGKFSVYGNNGKFFWNVFAKRLDIQVEPSKSDVVVKGNGPYTYV